jgi:hypothetical protein
MSLLEITENLNTTNYQSNPHIISKEEFIKHQKNKRKDVYYPKLPANKTESTMRGFFKRLKNYMKHQRKNGIYE